MLDWAKREAINTIAIIFSMLSSNLYMFIYLVKKKIPKNNQRKIYLKNERNKAVCKYIYTSTD